jgi:citronellol/citronellal dehydrogenase
MRRLAGRRALVTGASRGIGAALAERLAAEGADVALVARTLDCHPTLEGSLKQTAARVRAHGGSAVAIAADLANESDRARIVTEAVAGLGGDIHILVNNAAAGIIEPLATVPLRRVRMSLEVNILAGLDLAQQVIPSMRERREGWIVNISSGAARPSAGPPFELSGVVALTGVYGMSKAGLNRVTNALAAELWRTGIRVNTVEPRATILTGGTSAIIDATPGGLGMQPEGGYEQLEPMVEATLALCDCPESLTGRSVVSVELLAELGLTVHGIDGRPLEAKP